LLKPVQGGLPRQHSAIGALCFHLARNQAKNGIVAQFIVIVQVLVSKRNAMNALAEERLDAVLDPVLPAPVCEAGRRLPGQAYGAIGLAQQQRARVRGQRAAVERRCDLPAAKAGGGCRKRAGALAAATNCSPLRARQ
jgi:hypothetical protein